MAKYQTVKLADGEEIRLTERELLFCEYYLSDTNRNATQAALQAGYSKNGVRVTSTKILAKANIQRYIQHKTAPLLEKLGITQEKVLREFAAIGFAKLSDYMEDDYSMKTLNQIDPDKVGAMESVDITIRTIQGDEDNIIEKRVKFKLGDKQRALEKLYDVLNPVKGEQNNTVNNFFQQINNQYNSI